MKQRELRSSEEGRKLGKQLIFTTDKRAKVERLDGALASEGEGHTFRPVACASTRSARLMSVQEMHKHRMMQWV
jgi:hypothetical protein